MSTRIARLFVASVILGMVLVPATAWAGCTFQILPNPGYRGYTATMYGYGMTPGDTYYANFNGNSVGTGTVPANGNVSISFTIPNNAPNQSNWFLYGNSGCGMEGARNYTVNNGPPPTTTIATTTTTTTSTTTTTLAVTTTIEVTTTLASTTTEAPTTTVAPTTTIDDTTTTTEGESGGGGGISTLTIVLIVLVILLALGLAFALGRMRNRP